MAHLRIFSKRPVFSKIWPHAQRDDEFEKRSRPGRATKDGAGKSGAGQRHCPRPVAPSWFLRSGTSAPHRAAAEEQKSARRRACLFVAARAAIHAFAEKSRSRDGATISGWRAKRTKLPCEPSTGVASPKASAGGIS